MAIIRGTRKVLANKVFSQAELHEKYGGVVPEIASRNHLKKISPLLQEAVNQAQIELDQLNLIAPTYGPGLVGPLLVGLSLGKSLAYGLGIPFLGVNHLEGHIFAHHLSQKIGPPFLALLISGGHTHLTHVKDWGDYQTLGQTRDDAAGEAFDKVGFMTGLGYPAGLKIDHKSKGGDPRRIDFPRPLLNEGLDFSFAGLKTAVTNELKKSTDLKLEDLLASFQEAVVETLVTKAIRAARKIDCEVITAIGGVAANSRLRQKLGEEARATGMEALFPPLQFCTDNAAMIGSCGAYRHQYFGETSSLDLGPVPSLHLG